MLRVKHHLELDVTWCRHLEGIVLYLMSSHNHIIHIQLQRVDDHPFQDGQAGMLGVPSAWKWKLHCAAPFVSQCRTGPCVKWHLFFQDHKSGPNPTAAPLQAAIGDLIFADFKQNHLSAPVSLMQDTSCESDSLPPKNSAHPQNRFLNYLNTQPKTSVDLRCFCPRDDWTWLVPGASHAYPQRPKHRVRFAAHARPETSTACQPSIRWTYRVCLIHLNPTPNKQSPSHLDPLTTHEPFLFIFYLIFVLSYVSCWSVYIKQSKRFWGASKSTKDPRTFAKQPIRRIIDHGLPTTNLANTYRKRRITQPVLTSGWKEIQWRLSLNQC